MYPAYMLDTQGQSSTDNLLAMQFDAYYGLRPWDEMADPKYYEKHLFQGTPVPAGVRYKRDFEKEAAAAAAATPAADEPALQVTEGSGEIHIEIKYPGDALPSVEMLHRRQALENALEAAGAGEVTDAGGGGGVMDIFLRTRDVRRSLPLVEKAVEESGFGQEARIDTAAREEGNDE